MNRPIRTSSSPRVGVLALAAATVALAAATVPAHSAAKKPAVRIAVKAFTQKVAPLAGGDVTIPYDQRLSHMCTGTERAIGLGIVSSTHYLTSQSFGPSAGSSFVVGPAGVAKVRTQLLCAKNVKVVNRRVAARHVPGGTQSGGFGWAQKAVACPVGYAASGMQSTLDYAPAFGAYSSLPTNARTWSVRVDRVPDEILRSSWAQAAWVDLACVKATGASVVSKKTAIGPDGAATTAATCPAGRRALGWGLSLDAYTTSPSGGRWATPYVARAQFTTNGRGMNFAFRLPAGTDPAPRSGSAVEVRVVCGIPKG